MSRDSCASCGYPAQVAALQTECRRLQAQVRQLQERVVKLEEYVKKLLEIIKKLKRLLQAIEDYCRGKASEADKVQSEHQPRGTWARASGWREVVGEVLHLLSWGV